MGITAVVTSPTFTILNYYEAPIPLQHFDFYRLEREEELDGLGFEDYMVGGVTLIEWADKFAKRLPKKALQIEIQKEGTTERTFVFHIPDNTWSKLEKEVEIYAVSH
jgi:tRNA threonylcarbamoyladenosine biosynthesis protein TsaE